LVKVVRAAQVPSAHGQAVQTPPVPQTVAEVHCVPRATVPAVQRPWHGPVITEDVQAMPSRGAPGSLHRPPQSASWVAGLQGASGFEPPLHAFTGIGMLVVAGRTVGSTGVPAGFHLATHATREGAQSKAARHGCPALDPPLHTVRAGTAPRHDAVVTKKLPLASRMPPASEVG